MLRMFTRLLILVALLALLAGVAVAQESAVYEDPEGRYSVPVLEGWTAEETEHYVVIQSPEGTLKLYFLVVPLLESAWETVAAAWPVANPDFAAEVDSTLEPPSQPPVDATLIVNYEFGDDEMVYQAIAQTVGDEVYLLLVEGPLVDVQRRSAQINVIASGYRIAGTEEDDLTGVEPRAVDAEIISALEAHINELMPRFNIPGMVIAIVQDGEIVYTNAFGVRELGEDQPMTVDTHMMIGSTGKSLTTTLMATLVDDGLMTWDTPAVEILPQFQMADPELTQQITVRNLVCACTGVPRRDFEFIFNASELTAEDMVESLSTFDVFTGFGEAFQYSNQMVAAGGYVAAAAGGAAWGSLFESYQQLLEERVLEPAGMPLTTISFAAVEQRGEYAMPHALKPGFEYEPMPLETERILLPVAPAGIHWSTAEDMGRYLIMQLNNGVAADGARVVSEENLLVTREPQVAVSAASDYGLGWFVAEYKGLHLIEHGGNTMGFTSDLAFLPDAGLGVVVLTNAQVTNAFSSIVRTRLFDLVFDDVDAEAAAAGIDFIIQAMTEQIQLPETLQDSVDADVAQAFTGTYRNPALGELVVELIDGELFADAGEFRSEVLPVADEDDSSAVSHYLLIDPPLSGLRVEFNEADDGTTEVVIGQGVVEYTFTPAE